MVAAIAIVAVVLFGPARAVGDEISGVAVAAAMEQQVVAAIERAEKSVVAIARLRVDDAGGEDVASLLPLSGESALDPLSPDFIPNEFATGVVVGRGLVLTNNHVLGNIGQSRYYVTAANRRTYQATVIAADPRSDLAMLKIEGGESSTEFEPITFGNTANLRKGQFVISLGNPYAIARDGQVSASWGIIANLARKASPEVNPGTGRQEKQMLQQFGTLIQTDARLNLGTSGGALVNLEGEMIGLTTSIAALAGYEQSAGYAIAVDSTFLRIVETLKEGREVEYGFLGVSPRTAVPQRPGAPPGGAVIDGVVRGTPADKADLRANDIVTAINGVPIYDRDGLMLEVGKLPAGADVHLRVERNREEVDVEARLAKFRVEPKPYFTKQDEAWRGLRVDYITALRELNTGILQPLVEGAVAIESVEEGSACWEAGLRDSMYVTHVGNRHVTSPGEFREAVAGRNGPVRLRTWTEANDRLELTIEPNPS